MLQAPNRFWALAVLLFLIAAQVHVCLDAGSAQISGHFCQICTSGGWAIASAGPVLEVTQWTSRLDGEPPQAIARNLRTEASAPRAPPHA